MPLKKELIRQRVVSELLIITCTTLLCASVAINYFMAKYKFTFHRSVCTRGGAHVSLRDHDGNIISIHKQSIQETFSSFLYVYAGTNTLCGLYSQSELNLRFLSCTRHDHGYILIRRSCLSILNTHVHDEALSEHTIKPLFNRV